MRKLSEIQKETYNYIKEAGQIQTTNYFRNRKKKFVRITH